MMRPSRLSSSYASLLPALNRLGYRADVREASVYGSRCMVVVSGAPTTRVLNDGSWERDDGMSGPDPAGLLALYRDERAHMAVRNLARHDLKGVARDILVADGIPVGVILDAAEHDGGLAVSYRRVKGVPEDTVRRLDGARQGRARTVGGDRLNEEQLERLAEAHRAGMSATELTARTGLPWRTVATAIRMVRDRTRGPVPRLEFIEPAVRR